jgi:hypothetical protein
MIRHREPTFFNLSLRQRGLDRQTLAFVVFSVLAKVVGDLNALGREPLYVLGIKRVGTAEQPVGDLSEPKVSEPLGHAHIIIDRRSGSHESKRFWQPRQRIRGRDATA